MYLVRAGRDRLLRFLPRGEVVAEVGVNHGGFAETIVTVCQPSRLTLVDPWTFIDDPGYAADPANFDAQEGERRYQGVVSRFAGHPTVHIHRAPSPGAAEAVADGALDWVYIDAMHTRDAVLADLRAWAPKVRDDGFILGHDYAAHRQARSMGFGVVEAVHTFVQETGYILALVTAEAYPTYVLVKQPESQRAKTFVWSVVREEPCPLFHVSQPERRQFHQEVMGFKDRPMNLRFSWD